MTIDCTSAKIVYSSNNTEIVFNYPIANRNVQGVDITFDLSAVGDTTESTGGQSESIIDFFREEVTLNFNHISTDQKDDLFAFFASWAGHLKSFTFFPDVNSVDQFTLKLINTPRNITATSVGFLWNVTILTENFVKLAAPLFLTGEVNSVNGFVGDVLLEAENIPIDDTGYPIPAANVQEAIDNIITSGTRKGMLLQYRLPVGQDGGSVVSSWNLIPLNTLKYSTIPGATFDMITSRISLPAGDYTIVGGVSLNDTDESQSKFRDAITDDSIACGMSLKHGSVADSQVSFIEDSFTLLAFTIIEYQVWAGSAQPSTGFGIDVPNGEDNIYATLRIFKR